MTNDGWIFLLQGALEFLPVSSTAHLLLFSKWMAMPAFGEAEIAILHLMPGLIMLVFCWHEVMQAFRGFAIWLKRLGSRSSGSPVYGGQKAYDVAFFEAVVCGVLPPLLVGGVLHFCNITPPKSVVVIGANSIIFGVLMGVIDRKTPILAHQQWDTRKGLVFGLLHTLAFLPGVSRLGICLTAARALGFSREASARFAFLCGAPVLLMAGMTGAFQAPHDLLALFSTQSLGLLVGTLALSLGVLAGWMAYLRRFTLMPLALYRLLLGVLLLCLI